MATLCTKSDINAVNRFLYTKGNFQTKIHDKIISDYAKNVMGNFIQHY